jgi:mannose-1-phosphate guanylyltransferase
MGTATRTGAERDVNSNLNTIAEDRTHRVRADQAGGRQLKHEWAVILAGGDGTRLRSLTRRITGDERPKQFCPLIGQNTLLAETRRRVALAVAKQRTMLVVNRAHQRYYSKLLGHARRNVVEQPRNIGTAPAILYSILKIASLDPEAIVAFFPSDHYVSDDARFMAHVGKAFEAAHLRPDLIILLGIEPESPETEYGWIEPGQSIQGHKQLHRVKRFWEKPSSDFAVVLQRRGCLWNSFVMIAAARTLLDTIATATPALYEAFASVMPLLGTADESTMMQQIYALVEDINFSDRVLATSPERLAVLKVTGIKWNDLGEPGRVLASVQTAGVRPRWLGKGDSLDPPKFSQWAGLGAPFGHIGKTESLSR